MPTYEVTHFAGGGFRKTTHEAATPSDAVEQAMGEDGVGYEIRDKNPKKAGTVFVLTPNGLRGKLG